MDVSCIGHKKKDNVRISCIGAVQEGEHATPRVVLEPLRGKSRIGHLGIIKLGPIWRERGVSLTGGRGRTKLEIYVAFYERGA